MNCVYVSMSGEIEKNIPNICMLYDGRKMCCSVTVKREKEEAKKLIVAEKIGYR